jgi:hypothetical protein
MVPTLALSSFLVIAKKDKHTVRFLSGSEYLFVMGHPIVHFDAKAHHVHVMLVQSMPCSSAYAVTMVPTRLCHTVRTCMQVILSVSVIQHVHKAFVCRSACAGEKIFDGLGYPEFDSCLGDVAELSNCNKKKLAGNSWHIGAMGTVIFYVLAHLEMIQQSTDGQYLEFE